MKLSLTAILVLVLNSAWAQSFPFLLELKDYLQLSDSQLQTILTNNGEYNSFSQDKQTRIWQVQSEIRDETGQQTLDPLALGVRYAEIETICRAMKDQATVYRNKNTDLLTDAQKAKLTALEEAMKLAPVIQEGLQGNLIGELIIVPSSFASSNNSGGVNYGFAIGPTVDGCAADAGSFTQTLVPTAVPVKHFGPSVGGGVFRVGGGVSAPVRLYKVKPGSIRPVPKPVDRNPK